MGNDSPSEDNGIQPTEDRHRTIGWKAIDAEVVTGLTAMMHDGDQQLFNPYGPQTGGWSNNAIVFRGNPFNGHDVEQRSIRGGKGVFLQEYCKHYD